MDRCVVRFHLVASVLLVAVALTGARTTVASAGGRGFPSNLAVLERLSLEALSEAVDSLRLESREPVSILARSPHEANGFVLTRLAKILIDRGHEVTIVDAAFAEDEPKAAAPAKSSPPPPPAAARGAAVPPATTAPIGALELDPDDPAAVGDTTGAYADSLALLVDPLWGEPLHPEAVAAAAAAAKEREARAAGGRSETELDEPDDVDAYAGAPSPRIVTDSNTGLPAGHLIELKIQEFGVSYADVGRHLAFGPVTVTRVAGCYLELTHLIGPAGSLRRMSTGERHWVDRLGGSDRVFAEGAGYPFTRPELKPPSLGKYVEPAVVVGVVGSLIYLFYANQN